MRKKWRQYMCDIPHHISAFLHDRFCNLSEFSGQACLLNCDDNLLDCCCCRGKSDEVQFSAMWLRLPHGELLEPMNERHTFLG